MQYKLNVGDTVVSKREFKTGYAVIPAGTTFTITRRFGGYWLRGPKCESCGVALLVNKVHPMDVRPV